MSSTMAHDHARRHRLVSEIGRPEMAKADLRIADLRPVVGRVIERVRQLAGLDLNQFADAISRDSRQVARWRDGLERPQFDAVLAVEALRAPLAQAWAECCGAEVTVQVSIRRTA